VQNTQALVSFKKYMPLFVAVEKRNILGVWRYNWVSERITNKRKILRWSGEGGKGRCLPWSKEEEEAYIFGMKQVPVAKQLKLEKKGVPWDTTLVLKILF
jgi:hypothetical protein